MRKSTGGNVVSMTDAKEAKLFAFNKLHYGSVIRANRKKMGYTQQQIADMVGVTKNNVTNWEAGRARPDLNVIPTLCKALSISMHAFFGVPEGKDVLTAEEHRLIEDYRHLSARDRLIIRTNIEKMRELNDADLWNDCKTSFRPIPHNYQRASAGTGDPLSDVTDAEQAFVRISHASQAADEIVTVNGSSMEPMFHHGQDVFIEHTPEIQVGEIGLFVVNGEGFIKEWAGDRLHSLNPEYDDILLCENDDIRCVGRVLGPVDKADYPTPEELAVLQELRREKAFGQ